MQLFLSNYVDWCLILYENVVTEARKILAGYTLLILKSCYAVGLKQYGLKLSVLPQNHYYLVWEDHLLRRNEILSFFSWNLIDV